ncbi:MAG: hypothetical protein JNL58_30075 [Planctomyces sp.]|nr:hypothetical protein [Planctomyces sp.]
MTTNQLTKQRERINSILASFGEEAVYSSFMYARNVLSTKQPDSDATINAVGEVLFDGIEAFDRLRQHNAQLRRIGCFDYLNDLDTWGRIATELTSTIDQFIQESSSLNELPKDSRLSDSDLYYRTRLNQLSPCVGQPFAALSIRNCVGMDSVVRKPAKES